MHRINTLIHVYTRMRSGPHTMSMHLRRSRPSLCAHMSINNIPDHDGHVHTSVHHENRSFIQRLALMCSAITMELLSFRIIAT